VWRKSAICLQDGAFPFELHAKSFSQPQQTRRTGAEQALCARHINHRRMNMGLGNIGLPGLLLIAVVVLVLFGRGKISSLMGEVGKGITSFKKGINEGEKELADDSNTVDGDVVSDQKDTTKDTTKDKA
jgi:sec-independent protein translocase protein TatA